MIPVKRMQLGIRNNRDVLTSESPYQYENRHATLMEESGTRMQVSIGDTKRQAE